MQARALIPEEYFVEAEPYISFSCAFKILNYLFQTGIWSKLDSANIHALN